MHGLSGFVEELNIQNCIYSTGNCVHYKYELSGFAKKLNIQNYVNSTGNCFHDMYGLSGFVEKLNIQNYVNSTGNCVLYSTRNIVCIICTKCLDLLKN